MTNVRTVLAAAAIVAGFASTATFAQTPSEEQTSRTVLAALDNDVALRADALHVQTVGNTVYIRGQVDSVLESENAEKAARSVPNVDKVVNQLGFTSGN